ncbi:MAG: EAL domain-containing protein [Nitrosomonadales bacterium]|nr:EAL domain-containing protein [Nitrosomonadales bacterium]
MHRLLIRQLQRHLGENFVPEGKWRDFVLAVDAYYKETEQERTLLENALVVNSKELTEINERLREQSAETTRVMLNTLSEGVYAMDMDGRVTFMNLSAENLLGWKESELVGMRMHEVICHSHPDGSPFPFQECPLLKVFHEGVPVSGEYHIIRRDGQFLLVLYRANPLLHRGQMTGTLVSFQDVTERRRMEDEMQLASLVYQHTGEGMLVTDVHNRIVAINPACVRITGYTLDDVLGKDPGIFSSGRQDQVFYKAMWESINTTGFWHGEIWDRRKNGEIYAKWLTINRLASADGSLHGYVALFSDITEKKLSEEVIWRQANFDMLTGLPNRRMFRDRLQQEVKKEQRAGLLLAVLFIDLDHFKEVNDMLGHHVGDELLVEAGRRIVACTRESDTVARLGGDEFTVILTQLSDSSHVGRIAQDIVARLAEPFHFGGELAYVSASIGITLYPDDASEVEQLLKNADQAMYAAKSQGRNRYSYFTPALQEAAQDRLRLTNDLRGALGAGQFALYFQPIVELASGRIRKAEALLRWRHTVRGMVEPTEFIPLAEETGLIIEIGDWVFREAARWAARWNSMEQENFQISINKSPAQFMAEGGMRMQEWFDHLATLGLSGKHVVIEITEGLLLNADPQVTDKLSRLRDAHFQMAIDDFGTGYSSLAYLKKFDLDYLKIDRSFVRNIISDTDDMALCEAIIVMAHKLGLKVIAEGVETKHQHDLLLAAGCDYAQGFLFSRPVLPEEFEEMLKRGIARA